MTSKTEADVHFHPKMLQQLENELKIMNRIDIEARRNKSKHKMKLAEFGALQAVLELLDQLKIESFPLIRLWMSASDAITKPVKKRGHPETSDDEKDLRVHALLAAEFLERGGMPADKAYEAIEARFSDAGRPLAKSALRNWRNDFCGEHASDAKVLKDVLKEYEPDAVVRLMSNDIKAAYWRAAGYLLSELDFLIRVS
jgi:hypothetical protein